MNGILQTVLDSYHHYHPETTVVNGLVSLGIFYGVCAITNWAVPSIITVLSPVTVMVIGSLFNTAYMTLFIGKPNAIAVYIFSVLIGCAGALIWVGQERCSKIEISKLQSSKVNKLQKIEVP